jgi:hypothetical protein
MRRTNEPAVAGREREAALRAEERLELRRRFDQAERGEPFDAAGVGEAAYREGGVGELEQDEEAAPVCVARGVYTSRYLRESGTLVAGSAVASCPSTVTRKLSLSTSTLGSASLRTMRVLSSPRVPRTGSRREP